MNTIRGILKNWVPLGVAVTLLCGLFYLLIQQSMRMNANDPQIQMANDTAAALAAGQPAEGMVSTRKVDLSSSTAPYLIVFDQKGQPVASNAELNNSVPDVPSGVFDYVKLHGEDRITWQPQPGVRSAAVIVPVSGGAGGYVLAGRSLRDVEQRIDQVMLLVAAGWLVTIVITLAVTAFFTVLKW